MMSAGGVAEVQGLDSHGHEASSPQVMADNVSQSETPTQAMKGSNLQMMANNSMMSGDMMETCQKMMANNSMMSDDMMETCQKIMANNSTMPGNKMEGPSMMGGAEVMASLSNKTGDEFDKAFLADMIVHHQGALDMAQAAKKNAKHDEIKKLADDIISAQTQEITKMKEWQTSWGYA